MPKPKEELQTKKIVDQELEKNGGNEPFDELPDDDNGKPERPDDNKEVEIQDKVDEFVNRLYKIGYNIDVLEDNYLLFELNYVPLNEFKLDDILSIEGETTLSVKSEYPLSLQKWNYINYGITNTRRLFIQVVNEGHPIDKSKVKESKQEIDIPGFSLKYFINNIIKDEETTSYDKIVRMRDCVIDDVYLKFPPIIIGGIENKNKESQIVQSTQDNKKIPNQIKKFRIQPGINNGLKDFQIGMFRYYNKELTRAEKENEYKIKDLKSSDLSIKNNCFIDLQFEEIDDNKIQDLSGNANHGILVGDMQFDIHNDGENFNIIEKNLPELKNEEGPF